MKKYSQELGVGLFVLAGLLCLGYLTIKLGKMEMFSDKGYVLTAKFDSISGLKVGASVEMAGVPVGKVTGITLDRRKAENAATYAYRATVTLRLDDAVELADDSIASIKTSGLIGDKYIRLSQGGSSSVLEPGGEIEETESTLDIESLISKFAFGDVSK